MKNKNVFLAFFLFALVLSACALGSTAAQSVENYYQALVDKDAERAKALSCADWEVSAQVEVDSFQAVEASLDNLKCEESGKDGEIVLVTCQGRIVMSYDGENQYLDLAGQTFRVQNAGGDWLFCGYQ